MSALRGIVPERWTGRLGALWPRLLRAAIVVGVLLLSALLGYAPPVLSPFLWAAGLGAALVGLLSFHSTIFVLTVLVATSALVDFSLSTGTMSSVHFSLLLIILCTAVWVLRMLLNKEFRLAPSLANRPLLLFNLAVLVSWVAGYAFWKPIVPRPDNAFTVQAGQVAMYVLSAAAFFLAANHPLREKDVKRWSGLIMIFGISAVAAELAHRLITGWSTRLPGINGATLMWPFVLLWAQLLFNPNLSRQVRAAGWLSVPLWGSWFWLRYLHWKGGWVPALLALGIMVLLRFRRRLLFFAIPAAIVLLLVLTPSSTSDMAPAPTRAADTGAVSSLVSQVIFPEQRSGSFLRFPIWYDILRMTAHSPLFGLGPANYMYYWRDPTFDSYSLANSPNWWAWFYIGYAPPSHNMFVDVLAQTGVVGLSLFLWAAIAIALLANQARRRLPEGFLQAYAHGVLAGFLALLVASFAFADWLIPFVYNITIRGFQHSVYSWLLLGSLVPLMRHYGSAEHTRENP